MPVDDANAAVIATELRLLKEDIGRRLDDHRDDIRSMRTEMASSYVHQQAYQAEYGRMADRVANVEADVVELRTSLATQFVDVHGHIDRRFADLVEKAKEDHQELVDQAKDDRLSRRWVVGVVVTIATTFLMAATAVVVAVVQSH